MRTRILIAEDELHSRERLRDVLAEHPDVDLVGEATDGPSAVEKIDRLKPDLVFLDIHMPGCTGLEVLARIRHRPLVIFVTAYDQYALKAFEESAVDYVLKPSSRERIAQALDKALQRRRPLDSGLLALLERAAVKKTFTRRFLVRTGDDFLILPEEDVVHFRAEDKYVFLCTGDREFITDFTLKELEQSLDPDIFIRIHKSYIVSLPRVKRISRWFQGEYTVELSDAKGTRLKLGRAYQEAFWEKVKGK